MFSNPGLQDLTSFAALATNNQTNKDMQHILPPKNLSASFSTTDSITEHLLSDDCRVRTFCARVCESYLSFFKPFSSSALLPSCRSDPSFQVLQVIFYLREAEPGQKVEMETKFKAKTFRPTGHNATELRRQQHQRLSSCIYKGKLKNRSTDKSNNSNNINNK